jgi:hypothetical protein
MSLQADFETVLDRYASARAHESFSSRHPIWRVFGQIKQELEGLPALLHRQSIRVRASAGQGNWANVPWIAFLAQAETRSTQNGVYPVYLFRADMSAVYLTFNQGVTELKKQHGVPGARTILQERAKRLRRFCRGLSELGFSLDNQIDLRVEGGLGVDYEHSTIAHKAYSRGAVPTDDQLVADLEAVLVAYDAYLEEQRSSPSRPPGAQTSVMFDTLAVGALKGTAGGTPPPAADFDLAAGTRDLVSNIHSQGFIFEPWQIATYITAVRTKPFVILAGVSGTGKSKLPALVAKATGGESRLVPVRPDWTDSADVLGYVDLQGVFRPGAVMEVLHEAREQVDRFWTCIVDEMNLARVEQYFAEVLSLIEDRHPAPGGGFESQPLLSRLPREEDSEWAGVNLPPNLALIGTVNMDETTHGFSRKVLDRAFTLELSDIDLTLWAEAAPVTHDRSAWPVSVWYPRATSLAGLPGLGAEERQQIDTVIRALTDVNRYLIGAQLQVGYRTRDETALFVLHAQELSDSFVDREGSPVDPLDLALQMKVLPRIVGGSSAVRHALMQLLGWSNGGVPLATEDDARAVVEGWEMDGRPGALSGARFPRTAARLCIMWERMIAEGYTSFWL